MDDETVIVGLLIELQSEIRRLHTITIHKMLVPTLSEHGIRIGWNRLHEIRAGYNLLNRRKRKYVRTTDSNHRFHKYPNRIRDFEPISPGQLWVSDITYIRVSDRFCFLSLITDAYSRFIVGYCLYPTLEVIGPLTALRMAISNLKDAPEGLIHHSDRGIQYCCDAYTEEVEQYCIEISMTEKGDPYENAIAERVNGILKENYDLRRVFPSEQEAQAVIERSVYSYNFRRPHRSIEKLTPYEAHQKTGKLERTWKKKTFRGKDLN